MSHPKQSDAQGNFASTSPKHTRRRSDEDQQEQHADPPPAHVSPAMRIYRHALEAVLGILELNDFSRAVAVSRDWSDAVRSMKPIHARIERNACGFGRERKAWRPLPPIASIVASPILRHIAAIHITHNDASFTPLDNDSLGLLAQHAPNLQSLWCKLIPTSAEPLVWPPKLSSLTLKMGGKYSVPVIHCTDEVINGVLAALPSLSSLCLELPSFADGNSVNLSILGACRSLHDLQLGTVNGYALKITDTPARLSDICVTCPSGR